MAASRDTAPKKKATAAKKATANGSNGTAKKAASNGAAKKATAKATTKATAKAAAKTATPKRICTGP